VRLTPALLILATVMGIVPGWAVDDGAIAGGAKPQVEAATAGGTSSNAPERDEPGLEDRQQRYARSTAYHIAMIPAYVLRAPFQVVNYPIEHWLVHRDPGAITVYAGRAWSRARVRGFGARIGGLGSGSGTGGGLRYRLPTGVTFGKPLTVSASVTYRLYVQYAARLDSLHAGPVPVSLQVLYNDRPQEDFYGLGPRSELTNHSTYRLEEMFGTATFLPRIYRDVHALVLVGASRSDVTRGRDSNYPPSQDVFDPTVYEGLSGRYSFFEYGLGLVLDKRDVPTYAHHGRYLSVAIQGAKGIDGTQNAYTKYAIEAQQFLPLPAYRHTLALRFRTVLSDNQSTEHPVPVFRLEAVGSSRTIRGYQTYRFTDEDVLLGSVEYRFPIWNIETPSGIALDGGLFFDFGTALPELGQLQQRDLRSGGGFGFRLVNARRSIGRMDVAFTPEGARVHFSLRGAF
jgi:Omp85 superfamily domain